MKRNTDCVYFLASPLTCKKGSECEYRHSEYARLNPRDCWYWLNGNCLNPKCTFRHPPLDASLGTQAATTVGSSAPPSQSLAMPAISSPCISSKQAVPCIFYQKGLCLKGDRCAFFHAPNPTAKIPQALPTSHVTEPTTSKKTFGGLEKCNQEQKIPQANITNSVGVPPERKSAPRAETALPRNVAGVGRNISPPTILEDEASRYKATIVVPVISGNSASWSNRSQQANVLEDHSFQNGKDADEYLRESSPGFDVLVDDELRDSDYYHGEDQFGRTRGHEGRNVNSVNDYDMAHATDYNSMTDVDRESFHDPRGHGSYDHMPGQYAWEQHRASSERMLAEPSNLGRRRGYHKSDSPDHIDGADLRYHLAKQRRTNGLRSVVSRDYAQNHVEEWNNRPSSRRDALHLPSNERNKSSLNNRFRGRIKLPVRSSPVNGGDLHPERELDKGRNWGRLSPERPQIFPQGRLRDRIKGRVQEDHQHEGRNFRGTYTKREIMDDNVDFTRPKSLAELKVVKNIDSSGQQSLGKRKNIEDHQQSEGHLSFEGPKPLSEILKKKRDAKGAAYGSGKLFINREEDNQREINESLIAGSGSSAVADAQITEEEADGHSLANKEESKYTAAVAVGTVTKKAEAAGQSSQAPNLNDFEAEDGMIFDETMADHELEADDQRDGDYEYEQVDEGEYNVEGAENAADLEEEYLDDEDGDDFAKKIGVMLS